MNTAGLHLPHPHRRRARRRRARTGSEPVTALSDYPLRRAMSWWALVLFVLGTAGCAVGIALADTHRGAWILATALCAAGALIAAIDLRVIANRTRGLTGRGR
jgi:hypothetical protein